jgi:hypothetical protein
VRFPRFPPVFSRIYVGIIPRTLIVNDGFRGAGSGCALEADAEESEGSGCRSGTRTG